MKVSVNGDVTYRTMTSSCGEIDITTKGSKNITVEVLNPTNEIISMTKCNRKDFIMGLLNQCGMIKQGVEVLLIISILKSPKYQEWRI